MRVRGSGYGSGLGSGSGSGSGFGVTLGGCGSGGVGYWSEKWRLSRENSPMVHGLHGVPG